MRQNLLFYFNGKKKVWKLAAIQWLVKGVAETSVDATAQISPNSLKKYRNRFFSVNKYFYCAKNKKSIFWKVLFFSFNLKAHCVLKNNTIILYLKNVE